MNPRRKLLLTLRKGIKAQRRFDVVYLGGITFRYTCRTCGAAVDQEMRIKATGEPFFGGDTRLLARFARYQGQGVSGTCDKCTQEARDKRYPLPPK